MGSLPDTAHVDNYLQASSKCPYNIRFLSVVNIDFGTHREDDLFSSTLSSMDNNTCNRADCKKLIWEVTH